MKLGHHENEKLKVRTKNEHKKLAIGRESERSQNTADFIFHFSLLLLRSDKEQPETKVKI